MGRGSRIRPRGQAGGALLAGMALCLLALAAVGQPAAGTPRHAKTFRAKSRIRAFELLRPTRRPERGSLVVWIAVDHGAPASSVAAHALLGSSDVGTATIRLTGAGSQTAERVVSHDLRAEDASGARRFSVAYSVRFSKAQLKPLGGANGRFAVSVTVLRSFDRKGAGNARGQQVASLHLTLKPKRLRHTFSARDGTYYDRFRQQQFTVHDGVLDSYSKNDSCPVSTAAGSSLIDPRTAHFRYDVSDGSDRVDISGKFTSSTTATASGTFRHGVRTTCSGTIIGAFTRLSKRALAISPAIVTRVNPHGGPTAGGTGVVIYGAGFAEGPTTVAFGTLAVKQFQVITDNLIIAESPPAPGTGAYVVSVTNAGGQSIQYVTFTYT